ncbi:MAG TPA: endolytic transglycosylase MltG [Rhizomicrobium sp.]|nr:endolytic transglycosylase MltG [Rhizomicrobium sp.]
MFRFLIFLVLLGVIGVGVAEWANEVWTAPGAAKRENVVLIAPGSRAHDIAAQIQGAGAVGNALLFEAELHLHGAASKVKAGEYALPAFASMADIAKILVEGKSIQHKLTAAEGLTSDMIHKLVAADPVLVKDAGPVPAEGALLPETYLFTRGTSRAEMVARMEDAKKKFLDEQWAKRAADLPLATPEQAMILASIVEKETALPAERRHIAAVFVNRLKAGMKLQSDPTTIYGITKGYPLGRGIRESELAADTPYNTYAITGLPPTPICNPGKDSIAAVLNPAASADLYFVANGKGGHVFAATMAQHERNVVAWRAVERARQGLPPVAEPKPAKAKAKAAKPSTKSSQRRRRAR